MNINDELQDASITYQHYLEKHKNYEMASLYTLFNKFIKAVKNVFNNFADEPDTLTNKKLLKKEILIVKNEYLEKIFKKINTSLKDLSKVDRDANVNQLSTLLEKYEVNTKLKKYGADRLWEDVQDQPIIFDNGKSYSVDEYSDVFKNAVNSTFNGVLVQGINFGLSQKDMKSKTLNLLSTNKSQLNAFYFTMFNHTTNATKYLFGKQNDHVLKGYQWISVLDEHTTDICLNLSNQIWIFDHPELSTLSYQMYPPAHYRCRSTITYIVRDYGDLGITEPSDITREGLNGTVNSITYPEWFNKQTGTLQKDILGATRYDLYKSGTEVTQFYNNKYQMITLKQLQKKGIEIPKKYIMYIK